MTVLTEPLLLRPRLREAQEPCPQGSGCWTDTHMRKGDHVIRQRPPVSTTRRHQELLRNSEEGKVPATGDKDDGRRLQKDSQGLNPGHDSEYHGNAKDRPDPEPFTFALRPLLGRPPGPGSRAVQ